MPDSSLPLLDAADNLTLSNDGIWRSGGIHTVSYPEDGHDRCFALEDESFWFRHRNDVIALVARRYGVDGAFCDVGGGNGFVASRLQAEGFETVLVEPGPAGAMNARRRGVRYVVCATLEETGFPASSLANVGLFDVLEHIESDVDFLGSVKHHLHPHGRLFITVPAFGWLWSAEDRHAGHYRRYQRASLHKVLVSAGFQPLYGTYFFTFLVPPLFLIRSVPSALGIRRQSNRAVTRQEHAKRKGLAGRLVAASCAGELRRIEREQSLPFGTSYIVVAKPN